MTLVLLLAVLMPEEGGTGCPIYKLTVPSLKTSCNQFEAWVYATIWAWQGRPETRIHALTHWYKRTKFGVLLHSLFKLVWNYFTGAVRRIQRDKCGTLWASDHIHGTRLEYYWWVEGGKGICHVAY